MHFNPCFSSHTPHILPCHPQHFHSIATVADACFCSGPNPLAITAKDSVVVATSLQAPPLDDLDTHIIHPSFLSSTVATAKTIIPRCHQQCPLSSSFTPICPCVIFFVLFLFLKYYFTMRVAVRFYQILDAIVDLYSNRKMSSLSPTILLVSQYDILESVAGWSGLRFKYTLCLMQCLKEIQI